MKKGNTIYDFLQKCLEMLRKDFSELKWVCTLTVTTPTHPLHSATVHGVYSRVRLTFILSYVWCILAVSRVLCVHTRSNFNLTIMPILSLATSPYFVIVCRDG